MRGSEEGSLELINVDLFHQRPQRPIPECVQMMEEFIKAEPELWNEDIGE